MFISFEKCSGVSSEHLYFLKINPDVCRLFHFYGNRVKIIFDFIICIIINFIIFSFLYPYFPESDFIFRNINYEIVRILIFREMFFFKINKLHNLVYLVVLHSEQIVCKYRLHLVLKSNAGTRNR